MQLGSPIDAVAAATFHAAHIAFADVHYQTRDWAALEGLSMDERRKIQLEDSYPMLEKVRRPDISEIQVTAMFPQTWGSTALGFGGIGGAAMTPAYTVVVTGPSNQVAVYWAGQHAYTLDLNAISDQQRADFTADLNKNWTVSLNDADTRYGASLSRKSSKQAKAEKDKKVATNRQATKEAREIAGTSKPAKTPKTAKPVVVSRPIQGVMLLGKKPS